jgi:hypothetical protein
MRVVQVTGISGAGKSALSRLLRTRGHHAVSTDGTEGLCRWVDPDGATVQRPAEPSASWLAAHRWVWDIDRFDALIAAASRDAAFRETAFREAASREAASREAASRNRDGDGTLYVCGNAANDDAVSFDAIVLLDIDEATMVSRLLDPLRGNDFGRCGDSLAFLVEQLPLARSRYLDRGAVLVDATAPLSTVADQVLSV